MCGTAFGAGCGVDLSGCRFFFTYARKEIE
jgi:hypothetical protein